MLGMRKSPVGEGDFQFVPEFDGHVARAAAVVVLAIRAACVSAISPSDRTSVVCQPVAKSGGDRKNFPRGADSFPAIAIVSKPLFRIAESRSRFGHLSVRGFTLGNGGPLARRVFPVAFVF